MRNKLITTLFSLSLLSTGSFAYPVNSPLNQQATIYNYSSQSVLSTDEAMPPQYHNKLLPPGNYREVTYPSDHFTIPKGQTFSHTFRINSAADNKLICTVTSKIILTDHSIEQTKPTSSNPSKCETGNYVSSNENGSLYGFQITVKN